MSTIVIMPGGFHPFHAGHMSLYNAARKAFPNAEVYVAATNSQEARPFPFAIKEKLAKVAGVQPGHFIQVKSPFQAKEITQNYNPEQDVLIFVRSEKDRNESPKPGGMKKDGSPAYFQPYDAKNLQPFGKHAYFAYLPTVKFGPGITSATEIRKAWPTLDDRRKTAMVMSLYPATQQNPKLAANVVKMLDLGMSNELAEGFSDVVKGIKRKVAGKTDPKEVEHTYGRIARSAIKHKTPDQAEKDIERYKKVSKVVNKEGVAEGFDGEYDDEAGMAETNLHTIARAAQGLLDTIDDKENLPEWVQEKIAKVQGMMVSAWDYLKSQEEQGIDPRQAAAEGSLNEFAVDGFGDSGDKRSKLLASVGRLLDSGNKVDWQVPGQMGHVTRVQNDGITMKRWKMPHSKMSFFLPMYDDSRDSKYTIKMVAPKHYAVVSAEQGVAEAEKNPHTSAIGKALYRDLSKEKKVSTVQVQRNKERWAQRQAAGNSTKSDDYVDEK